MCSIADTAAAGLDRAAELAALVAHQAEVGARIAELLRDPRLADGGGSGRVDVGGLHADTAAQAATSLLGTADRAVAAATVLVGQVLATTGPGTGTLIGGVYASPKRWLQVQAGLAPGGAGAVIARARDLRDHSAPVGDAWLAGEVSGDSVRELTCGVTGMLKPVSAPRAAKEALRAEAVELLLPVAKAGTPADVRKALGRMRILSDPDGANQAAIDAYDDQSLTCVRVGDMSVITAHLTHDSAAAVMTVVDAYARRVADRDSDVVHDPTCPLDAPAPPPGQTATRWCSCGAAAAAGVTSKDRWPHLLAVAFTEVFTNLLLSLIHI